MQILMFNGIPGVDSALMLLPPGGYPAVKKE